MHVAFILFNFYNLLVESTVISHILQMRILSDTEVITCPSSVNRTTRI